MCSFMYISWFTTTAATISTSDCAASACAFALGQDLNRAPEPSVVIIIIFIQRLRRFRGPRINLLALPSPSHSCNIIHIKYIPATCTCTKLVYKWYLYIIRVVFFFRSLRIKKRTCRSNIPFSFDHQPPPTGHHDLLTNIPRTRAVRVLISYAACQVSRRRVESRRLSQFNRTGIIVVFKHHVHMIILCA